MMIEQRTSERVHVKDEQLRRSRRAFSSHADYVTNEIRRRNCGSSVKFSVLMYIKGGRACTCSRDMLMVWWNIFTRH